MNIRQEISEKLRRRLEQARTRYEEADKEYRLLMRVSTDTLHSVDPALSDGNYAARRAMDIHREAFLNYQNALKEFTDFTVYGKLPPDLEP